MMGVKYITQTFLWLAVLLMMAQTATAQQLEAERTVDLFYQSKPLQADDIVWSQFYDGDLYILTKKKELLSYAADGNLNYSKQPIYPKGHPRYGYPINATCFQVIDTAICLLNAHGFIVFDRQLNPLYNRPFGYTDCNGVEVAIYGASLPNMLIIPKLEIVIHPIFPTFGKKSMRSFKDCLP